MAQQTTKDMTAGNPMRLILEFTIPLVLGNLFQQVYNMVDTMIVGKILGVNALAAVGASGSVMFLVMGFCMGTAGGFAIPIAQKFGAKQYDQLKTFAGNGITLTVIISLFMTAVTSLLCMSILRWMNTPSEIIRDAYAYLAVIFAGIPFTMAYNVLAGYLRSLGDSRRPLYFLIVSSLLNIVLDFLFILGFHWGVGGAAAATVLSQSVSGVLCLCYIRKSVLLLHLKKEDYLLKKQYVGPLIGMGFPMGFQYSITAIGSVLLQTAINGLGATAVASITAAQKIDNIGQVPFGAIGNAMATYAGQNVGARRLDRVKKGLWDASLIGSVYAIFVGIIFHFFGKPLILLFVPAAEAEVVEMGALCCRIFGYFFIPLALVNIVRFTIQGMGFSAFAVLAGVAEMFARGLTGIVLVPLFGFIAACYSGPLAWLAADAFLIPAFFWCLQRLRRKESAAALAA